MFAFLRWAFVILLGFLLIVVFIWFAGPYFAFGDYRPLETPLARLIAIGVVIGCWLISKAIKRFRAYRRSDRLLAAVAAQPQPVQNRTPAEVQKLRERFDEAVTALKASRRSGHSLYDLPWYVIIGAPGSGKTTALLNSGLTFPLEQRVGKGALRGVGGTRNCDWWFTDEAIFLDTAGRYTTQDSDAQSDSLGWSEFLALLKKYRARRPINGVILTINAHDLIVEGPSVREGHVEAAQRRLEELNRELGIQLPVYLMVTKCDLVDGFAEYFDDLTAEGRAQVWGVTFPYDQTLSNEGPEAYSAEFDALMTRLNERVYERIEEVRDTRRRAKVFAFPQQMAALRAALTEFVSEVFGSRQFAGQVLLRGVYFTSGTQEGTPIDRLLGSIGRSFGAAAAVRPPGGPGKAYFVEDLLKDVMIGESGLAGINRRLEARKAAAQLGAYIAAGLIAAAGVFALSLSYNRNREFLDHVGRQVEALDRYPPQAAAAPIDRIVPRLDAIRAVVDSSDHYRDETTWAMRWGLYQGGSIGNSARDAYYRELDTVLLPRVGAQFRNRMTQFGSQPDRLYPYLKGYLMLGYPEHLDKEHVQTLAQQEWTGPRGAPTAAGAALTKHFESLLAIGELRPLPLDGTIVAQARSSLGPAAMPRMLYSDLKSAYSGGEGLRLDQQGSSDLEKVFRRKSNVSFSTPLPRLYTRAVFKEFTKEGQATLVQTLGKDAWVWGASLTESITSAGAVVTNVIALYEQDYMRTWDGLLDDLEVVPTRSIEQTREAYRILTSPNSPLKAILRVVADQTALAEGPAKPAEDRLGKAKEQFSKMLQVGKSAAGMPTVEPGTAVTAHFQWVRQLLAGEAGKTQLDGVIARIDEVRAQLETLGPDVAGKNVQELLSSPSFRSLLLSLRQQAEVLPTPVNVVVLNIARASEGTIITVATNEVDRLYDQEVLAGCRRVIADRYPFAGSGQPDVKVTDFGAVFGHDGLFDKFFKDNLEKQVDTTRTPWTWKPGSVAPARQLLEQFEEADSLRDMFFPPGARVPDIKFAVTLSDLDAGTSKFVITIDGQMAGLEPRGLVRTPGFSWPGPYPGRTEAAFDLRYFEPPTRYPGEWSLFRLIDATKEGEPDAQQVVRLKVQTGSGHQVILKLEPTRAGLNPFASKAWRQFNCEL